MNQEQREHLIKGKKVELILEQLNCLPTLPSVASRLLQITSQTNTQAEEVVALIESDQSLSSKILFLTTQVSREVNRKAVSSVSKAVVLLGFEAVRNAVLSIKVFETLSGGKGHEQQAFNRTEFWKHSLAVACASRQLVGLFDRKVEPEEAFICGLLHDMGKVALDACLPKSYSRVVEMTESSLGNLADYEQKILGIDHTIVGKRLAENWRLPQSVLETVWLHHHHPDGLPKGLEYRSIV
ncbi:MAG: HDOD domain-containing protein, partial [Planctomycetes bacterium]|nr:HDOD domain-containing protein [Planctomycetota bacterium]